MLISRFTRSFTFITTTRRWINGYCVKTWLSSIRTMRIPPDLISTAAVNFLHSISPTREEELDLERLWSLKAVGISPRSKRNIHKVFLENHCKTSITRNESGSTVQSFPRKIIHPSSKTNYFRELKCGH